MRRYALALLLLLVWATSAAADVTIKSVELGHGGLWVESATTPVAVVLKNSGNESVEVSLSLGLKGMMGGAGRHQRSVHIGASQERREVFLISGPRFGAELELSVVTEPRTPIHRGNEVATKGRMTIDVRNEFSVGQQARAYETRIVGTIGDPSNRVHYVLDRASDGLGEHFAGNQEQLAALRVSASSLRFAPLVLDGIDTLLVCNPDSSFCQEPRELDALLDWVALGGRLVVSLGQDAAGFGSSPLASHLPGRWAGVDRRDYFEVLPHDKLLPEKSIPVLAGPFVNLRPTGRSGDRLATGGDGTVVRATRPFGSGEIHLVPMHLPTLCQALVEKRQGAILGVLLAPTRTPERDLTDSLAAVPGLETRIGLQPSMSRLLQQDAFEPPPLPLVLLGLVTYVLVVGPMDWFILKRLKKERLTTLTFAAAVTAFTVLAYGASFLLFSSGAVVNRVVLVDLVDGNRDGRELLRVMDVAGYYAPTGETRVLDYGMPSVVVPGSLPGMSEQGGVGRARPINVATKDALRPTALLPIGFRSQRAVRGIGVEETGRTLDVAWSGETGKGIARVTNGLSIDLSAAFVVTPHGVAHLGELPSGETRQAKVTQKQGPGHIWSLNGQDLPKDPPHDTVLELFAYLSQARYFAKYYGNPFQRLTPREMGLLLKSGVDRSTGLLRGDGLVIGFASESPVDLPAGDENGNVYVIVRKEIALR